MHNLTFRTNYGETYTRINKTKARKLWGKETIALCPVKLRPGGPWRNDLIVTPIEVGQYQNSQYHCNRQKGDFEYVIDNFEYYNCQWPSETGRYTAFYLVTQE